ncbi:MAG: hypothetical protein Q8S73_43720 [Deltaproteobacteria bacterium]|nr:hypothetical protein [Deltaproteobacteria bacterium]
MTSDDSINGYVYVSAGFHLRALLYTSTTDCRWVIRSIRSAITELDRLGFAYPRNQLERVAWKLEEVAKSSGETTKAPEEIARDLRTIVDCIHDTVQTQAKEQRLVLLQPSSVSAKLRQLASRGSLNTCQTYLFDETVSNLETGAYRSAVVMGWNLAYDIIRQWVFDGPARLASFNAELVKIVDKNGKPKFDQVVEYSQFHDIGEKVVLDVCKGAGVFGGNLYDDLRLHLRQRNAYAHASDMHPTMSQANALIDHLVDAVAKLA